MQKAHCQGWYEYPFQNMICESLHQAQCALDSLDQHPPSTVLIFGRLNKVHYSLNSDCQPFTLSVFGS